MKRKLVRIILFIKLFSIIKIVKVDLPTFHVAYGNANTVKNIWRHSKNYIW